MVSVPLYYHYYLCENQEIVRLQSKLKPSWTTRPRGDTWIIQEWIPAQKRWCAVGEITWGRLKQLTYVGKVKPEGVSNVKPV